ncbi:MAG: DISARM system helicase DrmA [Verrucomicrobiales bacterium]|nr:DISARM system helicase DrmA [Verrucomicrobiales bacterium]
MVDALRRELMGPWHPKDETDPSEEFPTARYIVGRLAPQDSEIDDVENDALPTGDDDDGETGEASFEPPQVLGFMPSSMGLSFVLNDTCDKVDVHIEWGQYLRAEEAPERSMEGGDEDEGQWDAPQRSKFVWRREKRKGVVRRLNVSKKGPIAEVKLHPNTAPPGVTVEGLEDSDVCIQGVVYEIHGQRAVSLFLINQREKGEPGDSEKDQQFLMQAKMEVQASDGTAAFLAKDDIQLDQDGSEDPEAQVNDLLYRHCREFATGHGVAAEWDGLTSDGKAVTSVRTEFIPSFEVPKVIAADDIAGGATLDMMALSKLKDPGKLFEAIEPLVKMYESWITKRRTEAEEPAIKDHGLHREAAGFQLSNCEKAAERIRRGLDLLKTNAKARTAFNLANEAMADQRVHTLWAKRNQATGGRTDIADLWKVKNHKWRPFQLGFFLLNLVGVADGESEDRALVDLLWFPTGGGKTEAYLGLAAFTLFYRRLVGDRDGMEAGAGVSVIMRYTLRLLTVQQFQRGAALVCACEVIRRREKQLGVEPYRIGLWVGDKTAPNRFRGAKKAIEDLKNQNYTDGGSPVQLLACPRCGEELANDRGVPNGQAYTIDKEAQRIRVFCPNFRCEMSQKNSGGEGVPVVVVDEELYRTCPSIIIATVDKFARMPFEGRTQALFGIRDRHSLTLGHLMPADGKKPGGKLCKDAKRASRLLPPELIIQDELHLISGPLGTMVGLYETAVDLLSRIEKESGVVIKSKIIASTATIRRAAQQVRQLYDRELQIFPPSAIRANESFFAREIATHDDSGSATDQAAGRVYLGVNANGSSSKTLLVRVYAALLHAGLDYLVDPAIAQSGDPFGTLIGYFNSMRALGGAKRLVEDDVTLRRLFYLAQRDKLAFNRPRRNQRYISEPQELTSRLSSWQIPPLLKRMDKTFPRPGKGEKGIYPVDVLLATNMISVGVDIDRLGLMVCTGQPKTTAEYIQATSRIGRQHPGLVVTMYNWVAPRDISHYERFKSYHAALYRYVEPISVTPFSSRALDRGLQGMFGATQRLMQVKASEEFSANQFEPTAPWAKSVIEKTSNRATRLTSLASQGVHVRSVLNEQSDSWAQLKNASVSYSKKKSTKKAGGDAAHHRLFRNLGDKKGGKWAAPNSLRDVEPTATFFLDDDEKSNKPVGEVRPSQVITTFGPGAIVDLQTLSVVVAGVDEWSMGDEQRIQEPRLERSLGVKCFYSAPVAEGEYKKRPGTLPSYLFPRYQVCSNPRCGTLSEPSEQSFKRHEKRPKFLCQLCGGKSPVNPAPFIVACPSGHMDDFPWRTFVHKGPTACKQPMQLKSMGKTGTVRDLWVTCKCSEKTKRTVGEAFGAKKHKVVGACTGSQPWLGPDQPGQDCQHADLAETLQRGATNSWFPLVRSALSIKDAATPIGKLLTQADPDILSEIGSADDIDMYWKLLVKKTPGFADYSDDRPALLEAILKSRGDLESDETDLLLPEWEALRDPDGFSQGERSDFFSQKTRVPAVLEDILESVIQVRKLLEVRALTGFTRLESNGGPFGGDREDVEIAPISRNLNLDWLPAVEVRGEGLFFEFKGSALDSFAENPIVQRRVQAMIAASWTKKDEASPTPTANDVREKARFIVLHTP